MDDGIEQGDAAWHRGSIVIEYDIQPLHAVAKELEPFIEGHFHESREEEEGFAPDKAGYLQASFYGNCLVVTAREEGKIVGYSIFIISRYARNTDAIKADNHGFYVDQRYRGKLGGALLDRAHAMLKNLSISQIDYINDSEAFGRFITRKGAKCAAKIWRFYG